MAKDGNHLAIGGCYLGDPGANATPTVQLPDAGRDQLSARPAKEMYVARNAETNRFSRADA